TKIATLALLLLLSACTSVPFDYPRTTSTAIPPEVANPGDTFASQWRATHDSKSGFIGLSNGDDALGARLALMERAKSTIDAQYFIVKSDRAGALFAGKMLRAADRGVRVRLLIDDIFTPRADQALSLLSSHPNIEIRLFNPLSRQGVKPWTFLMDFKRANRRMHNKSFTVDNSASIVGGRNIGEEYFELKKKIRFDDYEVLTIGPVVEEISAGFDAFWNSELSVPIEAFNVKVKPEELANWREFIAREMAQGETGTYSQAINSTLLQDLRAGTRMPLAANAVLVTDSPDKLQGEMGDAALAELAVDIGRRFRAAESEIVIVTPYFIPGEKGALLIEDIAQSGVRVMVVTNSLASTNHVPVHSRYRKYRARLLKAGVEFREIRSDILGEHSSWGYKPERVTLHSKASVIDRKTVFVGSLNFDPRSLLINTEMGLFIESPEVGQAFTTRLIADLERTTYRVELDEQGSVIWRYDYGERSEVETTEPQASWTRRFMTNVYRLLPIEGQL
ncbi:MAG: phospholipase D family protein, partial [Halieaceae bacterium]